MSSENSPCGHFKNQQSTTVIHQSICGCRRKDRAKIRHGGGWSPSQKD
jgi:hypothetical protein